MTNPSDMRWKYAIVQHPMWLLIAEDSLCAERTPPWGCATLDEYADRIDKCLDSVEQFPQLHINWDFSAVELEDMAENYPKLMARMRKLTSEGRLSFVNGSYSQPHFQILSLESAIRQFEFGLKSIEKLTGYKVRCYASQEPCFSPQLPQILKAFGFESAVTPDFPYGICFESSGRIQHWDRKWEFLAGDDLVHWAGSDESFIPLWLKTSGLPNQAEVDNERQHGLLGHTRLRVDMPDMLETSAEWMEEVSKVADCVRLDQALNDLSQSKKVFAGARIHANYAYVEGVDTEELSRANTRAESALLSLEALSAFLSAPDKQAFDFEAAWKTILKAQHHDAYWTGGPELRAKSIARLNDLEREAREAMSGIAQDLAPRLPSAKDGNEALLVMHPFAKPHSSPVNAKVSRPGIKLRDANGRKVQAQTYAETDGSNRAVFVTSSRGLGYQTLFIEDTTESLQSSPKLLKGLYRFRNEHFSAAVRPDGVVQSLIPKGRTNVLRPLGGNVWVYGEHGEDVIARPSQLGASVIRGPVFDRVESHLELGPAELRTRLWFYHDLPWFEVETEVSFAEPAEIGDYFDDRTKLRYAWGIRKRRFCFLRAAVGGAMDRIPQPNTIAYPWMGVIVGGGLAFRLENATKFWMDDDGSLYSLVAWGHNGSNFNNRQGPLEGIMGPLTWFKPMDLRLRGVHTVRYAVRPCSDGITINETPEWAASLSMPPVAEPVSTGQGMELLRRAFVCSNMEGFIPLSVRTVDAGRIVMRFTETRFLERRLAKLKLDGWRVTDVRNMDGSPARIAKIHKIIEVELERK